MLQLLTRIPLVGRRPRTRGARATRLALLLSIASTLMAASAAWGVGFEMFAASSFSTGEKPQSKLWYHDGSYWGALDGPDGVAIYEKVGTTWVRGTYANAVLTTSGQADVKWNGTQLFVLVYASTSRVFEYTYNAAQHSWVLTAGFPVTVPNPSGSETMVIDQDSQGRLWTAVEGGGNINVYYSTSADRKTWSTTPVQLQSGVGTDDIATVTAFGGNKIGVFWSDQNRDHFGFRIHNDTDAPTTWSSQETVFAGGGNADDHINLATDSSGRVYAVTKDDRDEFAVHRRATNGTWTTKTNIAGGSGTRPIIEVAEADSRVYVLYTRWGVSPERIEYRYADINTLTFGNETIFISSSGNMNNVTSTKSVLPPGSLVAVAENGSKALYNSFGNPPNGTPPPAAPNLTAATLAGSQVDLAWGAVSGVDGYNVYRTVDSGAAAKINAALVAGTSYTDNALVNGQLCYTVRAQKSGVESAASNSRCVDNAPAPQPPGQPLGLTASLGETSSIPSILSLPFDEGSGQQANDQSGNGNHGQLGSGSGVDSADPIWVAGHSGTALQFDGSNDVVRVADAATLDPTGSFTIEAWVRRNGTNSVGIVSKGVSGARTYRVRIGSGTDLEFRWELTGGSKREVIVANVFADANWHHVACVYDQAAGQNRVYFDGVLRGSGSASGVPATNTSPVFIGAYHSSATSASNFLNGAIDAVRIAPSALYSANFTPASPGLLPPEALALSGAPGDGIAAQQVQLAWQAPTSGGAVAGYNIYRKLNGGTAIKQNASLIVGTSWNDPNPVDGELCYTVRAQNAQGTEGIDSNSSCVTWGTPALPPGIPGSLTATLQATNPASALLEWTAPSTGGAAVGYNVYRKVNAGTLVKLNASLVAALTYTDANLVTGNLCYEVAAVSAQAQEGTHTAAQCFDYTPAPPAAPSQPLALAAQYVTIGGGSSTGAAAYPLDENAGQTFADATGHGHTGQLGTAVGVDTSDPAWTTGKSGSALLFDGTADRCVVPDAADLRIAGSFTIEAWIQRNTTGGARCIVSKGDSQRRNFWIVIDGSNAIDFRWETSGGTNKGLTSSSSAITDAAWHHIACVFDQALGQNRIYKDGILLKSKNDTGTPVTSTDPVYVGARLSSGKLTDFFNGTIDLVRLSPGAVYTSNFTPPTAFGGGTPVQAVQLGWQAPSSGTPAGYNVYRQQDGGGYTKINAALVTATSFTDSPAPSGALCYQVTAVDAIPQEGPPSDAACPVAPVTKAARPVESMVATPFLGASPNPFNPSTRIAFQLPTARRVDLAIYDVRGRRISTLVAENRAAGEHVVQWSGRGDDGVTVASGAYFLVLRAGDVQLREKLILLK